MKYTITLPESDVLLYGEKTGKVEVTVELKEGQFAGPTNTARRGWSSPCRRRSRARSSRSASA